MSDIVERLRRRAESLEALSDCQMDQTTMAWRVEAQFSLGNAAFDNIEASTTIETLRAELARATNSALEEAAKLIEENIVQDTSTGKVLKPRQDGNRDGLAYAAAIRVLREEE